MKKLIAFSVFVVMLADKVVQRKYIINQLGGETPTNEYAYAYVRGESTPECLATCS